jgi:predicted dinucleotide-binding enzyme
VAALGDVLGGKLILDITNPFGAAPAGTAGIEVHRRALGRPARWAAAFKTNFAATIAVPAEPRWQCLVAAESPEVFGAVAGLARDVGYDPVDCGGLDAAATIDLMVPLMIDLDRRAGGARGLSAWRFVPGVPG